MHVVVLKVSLSMEIYEKRQKRNQEKKRKKINRNYFTDMLRFNQHHELSFLKQHTMGTFQKLKMVSLRTTLNQTLPMETINRILLWQKAERLNSPHSYRKNKGT